MNAKTRFFNAPATAILRISTQYDNHRAILIDNRAGLQRAGLQLDAAFFPASRRFCVGSSRFLRLNGYKSLRMRLY